MNFWFFKYEIYFEISLKSFLQRCLLRCWCWCGDECAVVVAPLNQIVALASLSLTGISGESHWGSQCCEHQVSWPVLHNTGGVSVGAASPPPTSHFSHLSCYSALWSVTAIVSHHLILTTQTIFNIEGSSDMGDNSFIIIVMAVILPHYKSQI